MSQYITLDEAKAFIGIDLGNSDEDDNILAAILAASDDINAHCDRTFDEVVISTTNPATARVFYATDYYCAKVDDIATTTDLVVKVDDGGTGTYGTTWSASDFQLEPLNGVVDGVAGFPYWRIRALQARQFPTTYYSGQYPANVQVTAHWGWLATPEPVKQSCRSLTGWYWKTKDALLGVAGYGEFGQISVRENPVAARLLERYAKHPIKVA